MASDDYHFLTEWRVAGTIDEVKAVLSNGPSLPRWWPSVYLTAEQVVQGDENEVGSAVALHTNGWFPYTLRWTLTLTEPITDAGFAISASGDLEGTGVWTFAQDGPEVVITYDWQVHASKPLLRRMSWLLKPAFAANHRWAMAKGEESLRLELRRRRAAGQPGVVVPPPPPATFAFLTRTGHPGFSR